MAGTEEQHLRLTFGLHTCMQTYAQKYKNMLNLLKHRLQKLLFQRTTHCVPKSHLQYEKKGDGEGGGEVGMNKRISARERERRVNESRVTSESYSCLN